MILIALSRLYKFVKESLLDLFLNINSFFRSLVISTIIPIVCSISPLSLKILDKVLLNHSFSLVFLFLKQKIEVIALAPLVIFSNLSSVSFLHSSSKIPFSKRLFGTSSITSGKIDFIFLPFLKVIFFFFML